MERRLRCQPERELAADIWAATYVLLGLRYSQEIAGVLLRGVLAMKESVTYQAIVEEGKVEGRTEEARKNLLLAGKELLGKPDAATRAVINGMTDLQQLEGLLQRACHVQSWQELLGTPTARRRNGSRRKTS
jgi:predicted transposase YdaD